MAGRIDRSTLIYLGFQKDAGNSWYYHCNLHPNTHLHLGASGGGDALQIDFLSAKLEDRGIGNFEQYEDGKFSVSKLENIPSRYYMTAGADFRRAINELNRHITT